MLKPNKQSDNPVGQRIAEAIERANISQVQLAKACGVTPQAVTGWIRDGAIKKKHLVAVAKLTGCTVEWLLTDRENRKGNEEMGVSDAPTHSYSSGALDALTDDVPEISWETAASADFALGALRAELIIQRRKCPVEHSQNTFVLRVQDDSMDQPYGKSYPPGCWIYIDMERKVQTNDFVLARLNGQDRIVFRQLASDGVERFLKPLNSQYPPLRGAFKVIGLVIGKFET